MQENGSDKYVPKTHPTPSPTLSNKKVNFKISWDSQTGPRLVDPEQKREEEEATQGVKIK